MHLQTLLSTCALALSANAVLVPSLAKGFAQGNDNEFWDSAKGFMVAEPRKTISLPCTGCPMAFKEHGKSAAVWKDADIETDLVMDFAVHGKQIKMNGQTFYPPSAETISHPLHVKKVYRNTPQGTTQGQIYEGDITISSGVQVHEKMEIATVRMEALANGDNPMSKTPMRRISFEIIGLEGKVIHVDTVELYVSESDDNLILYGINTTPYTKHSTPEGDACTTVLCRARASIRAKISAWRAAAASRVQSTKASCMRKIKAICGAFRLPSPRPHGDIKGHYKLKGGISKFTGDATLAPGGKNHPHGPYGHKHHGHGYGHHRHHGAKHVVHMVGRFFRHVVLPIFIGVAAGMAVSGIGMLIGQAIVLLYLRSRRNNGAYQSVEQTEGQTTNRESFDELPKYEEAPEYENAPAYEDEKTEDVN